MKKLFTLSITSILALSFLFPNLAQASKKTSDETKDKAAEEVFHALTRNYKSQVVLIHFWATWNSAGSATMKKLKPLQEKLSDQPVVFLNVVGEDSEKTIWEDITAQIRGTHIRLNENEWDLLHHKFNLKKLPRLMLVGKDGKVIHDNVNRKKGVKHISSLISQALQNPNKAL